MREATSKTTTKHLNDRIITEAKSLILSTDWNIGEIFYILGYEYATYFNNFFKKQTGTNPTAFKEESTVL